MSIENDSSQVQAAAAVVATATTAEAGLPTFPLAPGSRVNVRSGPGTNYSIIDVLPVGGYVTIRCQCPGTNISGPYGTTNIWDCIGNGRFVSDAYVKTGTDGYVAGRCA
ncbi:peptidase [Streptomyces antarcticus]|uniref:peptidase n=1 Tax=Streptomyces antarcticus TaxID=2996458 RepID=UPI00226E78B8|nr:MULTISPECIES: peptidase [unclassified Streptomyces]MCY0945089.1 peptidase [Streptomyces sp. H34-AA3]MCY0952655.1 peptidase [Streptomyces sp. H27-S2]MCZ4088305.1 peptidase [Streptomyces sp. H34-S5]